MSSESPVIDSKQLRHFHTLGRLAANDFADLLDKVKVEQLTDGRRLFARGSHDRWVYFLLEGAIYLSHPDGRAQTIHAGSELARDPVADKQPRPCDATASGPVSYLRINRNLLELLSSAPGSGEIAVEEINADDEELRNRLFFHIYQDLLNDNLQLPQLPDIAFRVRNAVADEECDINSVARIIQADPVLAARLIKAANSPLYGVQMPVTSCRGAVNFLGLNTTRDLVISYTLQGLFDTDSPLLKARMRELWQHSASVAALCSLLADITPGLDQDRAMLLGLLHDIGTLPVIDYATQYPELATDSEQLESAIEALRGQVGAMVLRQWQFGDETVTCAMEAEDWERDPGLRPDYVDAVVVAQALLASEAGDDTVAPAATLPAWGKLARGRLDEALGSQLCSEARERLHELFYS